MFRRAEARAILPVDTSYVIVPETEKSPFVRKFSTCTEEGRANPVIPPFPKFRVCPKRTLASLKARSATRLRLAMLAIMRGVIVSDEKVKLTLPFTDRLCTVKPLSVPETPEKVIRVPLREA